jgi:hypothetical protein
LNSSRPDWSTYLRIKELVKSEYGVNISIDDVEKSFYGKLLAWKVDLGDRTVYVNHDGTALLREDDGRGFDPPWLSIIVVLGFIFIAGLALFVLLRSQKNSGEEGGT